MSVSLLEFQQMLKDVQPTFMRLIFPNLRRPSDAESKLLEDVLCAIQVLDSIREKHGLDLERLKDLSLAVQEFGNSEMSPASTVKLQFASLNFLGMSMDVRKAISSGELDLGVKIEKRS
jgi:hypothetical protein